MTRNAAWPSILASMIRKAEKEPFEWGVNDCCLWVSSVVRAMTGVDPAKNFRGQYHDDESANEFLGPMNLKEMVTHELGDAIDVKQAQRGDVVLRMFPMGESIGICVGERSAFKTLDGLIQVPTLSCEHAWRIG